MVIDTMPGADVTFHLDTANRPLKTMNYYVQVLPGEVGDVIRNGISYQLYNSISARYNGVTSEDFLKLDGFERGDWTSGNRSGTYTTGLNADGFYIYNTTQTRLLTFSTSVTNIIFLSTSTIRLTRTWFTQTGRAET